MRTQHTQRQRDDEEDDAFQDGVLKDGARYTVPLRLMDSWQRDVAQHFDTDGRYPHTPGFIVRDGVIRTCLDDCYDAYDERISQQYKQAGAEPLANVTGQGSHGLASRVGDLCTVRRGGGRFGTEGAAGTLQVVDGQLECVADGHDVSDAGEYVRRRPKKVQERNAEGEETGTEEFEDHHAVMDALYSERDLELANAWRRGAND